MEVEGDQLCRAVEALSEREGKEEGPGCRGVAGGGTEDNKLWHFQNLTIFLREKQQVGAFGDFAATRQCGTRSHQELPPSVSVQPYCSITAQLEAVPMSRRVQSELQAGVERSGAQTSSLAGKNKLLTSQQETNYWSHVASVFMVTSMLMSCGKKNVKTTFKKRRDRRKLCINIPRRKEKLCFNWVSRRKQVVVHKAPVCQPSSFLLWGKNHWHITKQKHHSPFSAQ